MTWNLAKWLAVAAAIVGVVVAVAAPNHGGAIDPIAQAADTTAAAGSADFTMAGSINAAGLAIPLNGSGAIDMRNQRMRMSVAFPIPSLGQLQMEEIFDHGVIYMHMPDVVAQHIPGGKSWMKLDLQAFGKAHGIDFSQLQQAQRGNPTDMLQALKAVGSSHVVGHENLDGAPTTHYAASIDLNKVADKLGNQADSMKQLFKQSGLSSFPVDVWVDRSGRVRREGIKFSATGMSMDMTLDFSHFGTTVDTTPPPADQVMDASGLMNAAGAATGSGG